MCTRSGVYNLSKKVGVFFRNMDFESSIGELYGLFDKTTTVLRDFTKSPIYEITYPFQAKFSKHTFVGSGMLREVEIITDGVNTNGLYISALWNTEAEVDTSYLQPNDCLSGLTLMQVLLGNCKDCNDVVSLLNCKKVEYWDKNTKQKTFKYVGTKRIHIPTAYIANRMTCQLAISDITGTSYIIEFEKDENNLAGIPVLYRDPFHNCTNAPNIIYQHTNLRSQIGAMTSQIQNNGSILDNSITPVGYGNNWRGMTGDYTPPSRFLRALLIKSAMIKQKLPTTINEAKIILDKAKGSVRVPYGLTSDNNKFDSTIWTIFVDLFNFEIWQENADEIGFTKLNCQVQKSIKF